MDKLNICVFFSNKDIKSIESASTILNALNSEKYTTIPIYISDDGKWYLYDGSIGSILDIDIERVGTKTVLSPDTEHKGLIRIVLDKKRIIPIDMAISVLFSIKQEMAVRSMLEIAEIPFIGLDAFSYGKCTDFYIKDLIVKDNKINTFEALGFNKTIPANDIYKEVKSTIGFPVTIKSPNNIFSENVYYANKKDDFLESVETLFNENENIVVQKTSKDNLISILFINDIDKVDLYTPVKTIINSDGKITYENIDLQDDILQKVQNMCINLIKIFEITDICVISFYVDTKLKEVYFNDINTNIVITKNDVIKNILDINEVQVKEFLENIIYNIIEQ